MSFSNCRGYGHKNLEGWEVRSAEIETHGLNPRAVKVMAEEGIDISSQKSELIDLDYFNECDLIITLCGDALDKCPMIPKGVNHEHWDLQDPACAIGSETEIFNVPPPVSCSITEAGLSLVIPSTLPPCSCQKFIPVIPSSW